MAATQTHPTPNGRNAAGRVGVNTRYERMKPGDIDPTADPPLVCFDAAGNGHRAHHWRLPGSGGLVGGESVCVRCDARKAYEHGYQTAGVWNNRTRKGKA